jgi:hypothetical protein
MLERKHWHASITEDVILVASMRRVTDLEDPGFCLICGNEAGGVEPDAQHLTCGACGAEQVFGVDDLLMVVAA